MGFVPNQQETQYAQSWAYGPAHWASLNPEAAMAALGSRRAGLNKAEVAERLARYGHNTLPRLRRRPWYLELVANFIHLFALLLWAGAGLAWVAGMPQLAWAIVAVILINGLFSFWQEYQAERAAAKLGLSQEKLAAWPRLAELPFDSTRKRMTTIQMIDGDSVACVKGAPGEIFARCVAIRLRGFTAPFDDEWRRRAEAAHDAVARRGLRLLAVATRSVDPNSQANDGWRVEDVERELTLLGLIAMEDPPRPEVPSAVAACRQAGVRVVMVTGDHGLTAAAISHEIGLSGSDARVVTGAEFDSLDDGRLAALLDTKDVIFARVTPEHKMRLVEVCQRKGEVVAVTGDGVNDAPALKRADIGVAMGITGTDVAREAADMVLADDNFASIVAAIEEGRAVYDNVRKFVTYIFASNIPEIVPFIVFVLFRIPLPLTVMQILAVDLGTDLLPALSLGAESPEPDVMRRPPRSRRERLLNLPTLLRAYGWLGMIEAALSLSGFFFAYWLAAGVEASRWRGAG